MQTHHKIQILLGSIAALGGIMAIYIYFDTSSERKVKAEILQIEKTIKELELETMRNQAA